MDIAKKINENPEEEFKKLGEELFNKYGEEYDKQLEDVIKNQNRASFDAEQESLSVEYETRRARRKDEFDRAMSLADILGLVDAEIFAAALSNLTVNVQEVIYECIQELINQGLADVVADRIHEAAGSKLNEAIVDVYERYEDIEVIQRAAVTLLDVIYGGTIPAQVIQSLNWALDVDERGVYYSMKDSSYFRG